MKLFTGKTVEEALEAASKELNTPVRELIYRETGKTTGIFSKKVIVEVYDLSDVISFAEQYILNVTDSLEIEASVKSKLDDEIIRMTIDSTHNPILIGKAGVTLQALNELVKLATSNHFHKRFRILLDINGYKDSKYSRLEHIARKVARDVARTKTTYTFDPMPADERRSIHNAINGMRNVRTESIGEGKARQVQVLYVESKAEEK